MDDISLNVTGTLRTIAESAWISTIDEIKAKDRDDESVEKVVRFLVENNHTSPLECVTLRFSWRSGGSDKSISILRSFIHYITSNFSRHTTDGSNNYLTIDLLNFIKITKLYHSSTDDSLPWSIFAKQQESMALIVSDLSPPRHYFPNADGHEITLGEHGMEANLVSFHAGHNKSHSRATWRVRCPLSIAVQILRHRSGSFNMVSGRYRTVAQPMISFLSDFENIFNKILNKVDNDTDLVKIDDYFSYAEKSIIKYKEVMILARKSKSNEIISNDEYKRFREVARYVLPEGRMTELYATFYVDDFEKYLMLRDSVDAQCEHVWIAREMREQYNNHIKSLGSDLEGLAIDG